ncbi:MAG: DUF1552 domain-containing protein [Deltaproteobacteria bacterium]|nr:DUF1552 domain-containing protein [Deltaproteobacteria bacterium]
MSNFKLSRRTFISSSGTTFLLPLFPSWVANRATAQTARDPRRFVAFYIPNGTYNRGDTPTWYPATGVMNRNNLPPALAPFDAIVGDFSVLKHIKTTAADNLANANGQHVGEAVAFLTCGQNLGPQNSFEHQYAGKSGKAALVIQGNTADQGDRYQNNGISYLNGRMVRGISNPGDLYRQLVGQVAVPVAPSPQPVTQNLEASIIDSSLTDLSQLRAKLGRSDQQRLDDFLAGLRELELKYRDPGSSGGGASSGNSSATCRPPTNQANLDSGAAAGDGSLYLARMRMFNDLITIAFACDLVRSVSVMLDVETGSRSLPAAPRELVYQGADIAGWNNHLVSHFGHFSGGDFSHATPDGIPRCITRDRFYFSVVADLIQKLKAAKDSSGSVILDNSIVLAGFGVRDGMHYMHLSQGAPMIVGGGRNFMTPGQSLDMSQFDVADMFFTFNKHLDMGLSDFQGASRFLSL